VDSNGIMRLKPSNFAGSSLAGATIFMPENDGFVPLFPGFVSITIEDSGDNNFEFLVTDGNGQTFIENIISESIGAVILTMSNELDGIAKVELIQVFPETDPPVIPPVAITGQTLGISEITTLGLELEKINSFNFEDPSVIADSGFTTKTFDAGFFYSEGTAQSTSEDNVLIDAQFTDVSDVDYLPSFNPAESLPVNQKTFTIAPSSLSGFSNTGTASVKQDSNTGITIKKCEYDPGDTNGNGIEDDDTDRDGVCDSWEGKHAPGISAGIPYSFGGGLFHYMPINVWCPTCTGDTSITMTPSGNPVNLLDEEKIYTGVENANDLTPIDGKRDFYIEIDTQEDHPADIRALNDVIILWADLSGPPAEPHDAIVGVDYTTADGVALHIVLDKGRVLASHIDSDGTTVGGFDSGEPLFMDKDSSGTVSAGDVRLINQVSLADNYKIVAGGDSDVGTSLLAIGVVPDDALPHKNIVRVWRDSNIFFGDDFQTIKFQNYANLDRLNHKISTQQTNQIKVVNAATGEYNLIVSGLKLTTPNDPLSSPINKEKGTVIVKVLVKTSGGNVKFTEGNSDLPGGITMGSTGGGLNTYSLKVKSIATAPGGLKKVTIEIKYVATSKQTATLMDTLTLPFTMNDAAQAPLGCTSSSATDSFCDAPKRPGGFPQMGGRHLSAIAQVYRYAIFIHNFGGPSGEAELRGNDMVMALGNGFGTAFDGHAGGTRHQQAGTFAHELLHLANFLHGGPQYLIQDGSQTVLADTSKNCKPYPGVDKYQNQLPGFYLDLITADPISGLPTGSINDDVHSTSEWELRFSDGTHGTNFIDNILDPAHITAIGGTVGGLNEASLSEATAIPGTPYTMVWGTPTTVNSHASPHSTHKQLSTTATIDWDDSGAIAASFADITNFGIGGCGAGSDPIHFDYDTGYHLDLNWKQGPVAQFDGLTNFQVESTGNDLWRSIAAEADFDGLDPEEVQTGEKIVKAGSVHPIVMQLFPSGGSFELDLSAAKTHVFVTKDPDNTNPLGGIQGDGSDPRTHWVQIQDNAPDNPEPLNMLWYTNDPQNSNQNSLQMDWKVPRDGRAFNLAGNAKKINLDGEWFIRVVMFDNPLINPETGQPADGKPFIVCSTNEECLFGAPFDPQSNFLIDFIAPNLPDGEHEKATGKIFVTKAGPGNDPEPPGPQDLLIDELIAVHDGHASDKDMKKKTDKTLRKILNQAKEQFLDGNDGAACILVDEYEEAVENTQGSDLNSAARSGLRTAVNDFQTNQPCADNLAPENISLSAPNSGPGN